MSQISLFKQMYCRSVTFSRKLHFLSEVERRSSKEVHALILRTCEYVTLLWRKCFANWLRLRTLRGGNYHELSRQTQPNHSILKSGREGQRNGPGRYNIRSTATALEDGRRCSQAKECDGSQKVKMTLI